MKNQFMSIARTSAAYQILTRTADNPNALSRISIYIEIIKRSDTNHCNYNLNSFHKRRFMCLADRRASPKVNIFEKF